MCLCVQMIRKKKLDMLLNSENTSGKKQSHLLDTLINELERISLTFKKITHNSTVQQ